MRSANSSYQTSSPAATSACASGRTIASLSSEAWEMKTSNVLLSSTAAEDAGAGPTLRTREDGSEGALPWRSGGSGRGRTRAEERVVPRRPCMSTVTYQWPLCGTCKCAGDFVIRPPIARWLRPDL